MVHLKTYMTTATTAITLCVAAIVNGAAHQNGSADKRDTGAKQEAKQAERLVRVSSSVNGKIVSIGTEARGWRVGDKVEPGQLIVQLDDREAMKTVSDRKAKVEAAKADERIALTAKQEADERFAADQKVRFASRSVEEDGLKQLTMLTCRADYASKRAVVGVAEAELRLARLRVELHRVQSPVRGVIAAFRRQTGEAVRKYEPIVELKVVDDGN